MYLIVYIYIHTHTPYNHVYTVYYMCVLILREQLCEVLRNGVMNRGNGSFDLAIKVSHKLATLDLRDANASKARLANYVIYIYI